MTETEIAQEDEAFRSIFGATKILRIEDTTFIIVELAFHDAIFVEPNINGGFEDRYCMMSMALAERAIEEYRHSGKIRYWQKHHNKGISIACGSFAFAPGVLHIPENALFEVDWDIDALRAKYAPPESLELRNARLFKKIQSGDQTVNS